MKKLLSVCVVLFLLALTTTASAHTEMDQSSAMHIAMHVITMVSIGAAIVGVWVLVKHFLPAAKSQCTNQ